MNTTFFCHRRIVVLMLLPIMLMSLGCSDLRQPRPEPSTGTPGLQVGTVDRRELLSVNSILIAPPQINEELRRTQKLSREALDQQLYPHLSNAFRAENDIIIVDGEEILRATADGMPTRARQLLLARRFNADAVLVTEVRRYDEREGSRIGSNDPAIVDFSMELLRVMDGKPVWAASYHYADLALSSNLLRAAQTAQVREGRGWVSAIDALHFGFAAAAKEFATVRREAFLAR